MAPTSIVCLPDISEEVTGDGKVQIDFLLPNGIFIQITVDFNKPLNIVKQTIWETAKKLPLFEVLKGKDNYYFEYLNRNGEREEVTDESLRLSEIRPIGKFLRIQERREEEGHQTLDRKIYSLLGSKIIMEMQMPRAEVDDFRKKMNAFAQSIIPQKNDFQKMFEIKYPLRIRSSSCLPPELNSKLNNGYFVVSVKVKETKTTFLVQSHIKDSADTIIDNAVRKWQQRSVRHTYDFVLKVIGQEDYLYGSTMLQQFKYIYSCIQSNKAPEFWLVNRKTILSEDSYNRPNVAPRSYPLLPSTKHNDACVWDISDNFEFVVQSIQNIEITSDQVKDNIDKVKLFVGLYHGTEVLGAVETTSEMTVALGKCTLNKKLVFDLKVEDIQTASRLCFTLHGRMRGAKSLTPIAWVNIPVFDFRSWLLVGEQHLAMWPVTTELQLEETGCYPLGSVSLNPHNTIILTVNFSDYNRSPPIVFPSDEKINECVAMHMEAPESPGHPEWVPSQSQLNQLDCILKTRQQWEFLHEQDKEMVWLMRVEIREKYPDYLPLVLTSVKWHNHIDVAKMQVLLSTWKQKIPVYHALELLDFNFPDRNVRKYAVDCLQDLSDDEVSLYLLQLVQALKYENYLYCPLAEFLMERALRNQHIGQQLFWLLKSELHNPVVTVRYGLMLEAYLKSSPDHLSILFNQFEALNKLNAVSQLVKSEKMLSKEERHTNQAWYNMRAILGQKTYQEKLSNLVSPLSPLFKLNTLCTQQCVYMDSKKRPLYLVWTNEEKDGQETHIIYKNGDDLRQDMLTLQLLHVMDSIWQREGLDLRMNVYGCVATGLEQGMIEVVRRSATLAKIQKINNRGPFDRKTLLDWLKEKNPTREKLDRAIEEFTLSCAGYTVATYVLGIGDRHNDNIMLQENGQLFHIDFGHFLGNFKSFLGFKRERVPFVLTPHFRYIITKGDLERENYKKFEEKCVLAYVALRHHGHLLIRLFMMMLTSGIPQLSSVTDLDYLKETLALNMKEDVAIKQFKSKMNESLTSKFTQLNWKAHLIVH
ncbi:Phosphatidylinositol 4 [Mactra antiquata]